MPEAALCIQGITHVPSILLTTHVMSYDFISYHGHMLTVFEVPALSLNLGWWVTSGRCAAPPAKHQGFDPARLGSFSVCRLI